MKSEDEINTFLNEAKVTEVIYTWPSAEADSNRITQYQVVLSTDSTNSDFPYHYISHQL